MYVVVVHIFVVRYHMLILKFDTEHITNHWVGLCTSGTIPMKEFTAEDDGKKVIDSHGETVGMVSEVKDGMAYVDADPGIADKIKSTLGWDDADDSDYTLRRSQVDRVTDDEIHLRK